MLSSETPINHTVVRALGLATVRNSDSVTAKDASSSARAKILARVMDVSRNTTLLLSTSLSLTGTLRGNFRLSKLALSS